MELTVALVVAYALCGLGTVFRNVQAPMLQRRARARHPTVGFVLFLLVAWWVDGMLNSDRSPRAIAAATVGAVVQVAVEAVGVYGCWWLATLLADGLVARLLLATAGLILTQVFLAPLIKAPLTLLLTLLAIPIGLIFPGKKRPAA